MAKEPPRMVFEISQEKRAKLRKIAALKETTMKALVERCIDHIILSNPLPDDESLKPEPK